MVIGQPLLTRDLGIDADGLQCVTSRVTPVGWTLPWGWLNFWHQGWPLCLRCAWGWVTTRCTDSKRFELAWCLSMNKEQPGKSTLQHFQPLDLLIRHCVQRTGTGESQSPKRKERWTSSTEPSQAGGTMVSADASAQVWTKSGRCWDLDGISCGRKRCF